MALLRLVVVVNFERSRAKPKSYIIFLKHFSYFFIFMYIFAGFKLVTFMCNVDVLDYMEMCFEITILNK